MNHVTIILGSLSDKPVFEKGKAVFEKLGIGYDVRVASAHRTPENVEEIVEESDSDVFIAIAGLSAALPGVIAARTIKPVIGVPVDSKLGGLDALLSTAQMPPGIPVGCVGIDRGENAALLAAQILAVKDTELAEKLKEHRKEMRKKVEEDDRKINET